MATPPLLKHLNERNVLETIRAGAPISRAEISRRAGISKPTVSLALASLLDAGLVRAVDPEPGRPHYGAVYFEPVAEAALVLGLDIGARFLRGAVCDLAGVVRARHDVELPRAAGDRALATIARLRDGLVEAAGAPADRVDAAVVGIPGVVDEQTGRVSLADNVPFLQEPRFAERLHATLGLPLTIENDIGLAALGEQWRGVARGVDDFVFLSVGTGLGAGLVLGGQLRRGRHGAAGELDYALVGLGQDVDPCAGAVSAFAARAAANGAPATVLEPPFAVPTIFAAARSGDRVAREVVQETARRIALHIAPVSAVADVALVVLGGGLGSNGDLLLEPVRRLLADWLPFPPRVEVSSLGDAAVLTGSLAVGVRAALDRVFDNRASGPARSARR